MKKIFLSMATLFALIVCVKAQSWSLAGNSNVSSTSKLGTTNNISVRFYTNNVQRMIITPSAGSVGIGTASPGARLHVNSASGQSPLQVQVNNSTKLQMDQYGTLAIGTSIFTTSYKLLISSSTNSGIYANGVDFGVRGTSPKIGVQGYGSVKGVFGYSNSEGGKGVNGYAEKSYGGFFESFDGTALYAKTYNGFYAGLFYGNVYSSGTYYGSDKNIKKNIREVGNAMDIINQLKPKSFEFRNDGNYAALQLPKGNHYGLLAQDLEQVLPDLVKESPHELRTVKQITAIRATEEGSSLPSPAEQHTETLNIKSVNYTELIPIMIKAMQEQQAIIEKQNVKIVALTQLVDQLKNNNVNTTAEDASLAQNVPDPPVANSTIIGYHLPSGTTSAQLIFTNAAGQKVKQMQLDNSGRVRINTSSFSAGIYFYTLSVNGKLFQTKKMVIGR
jgi:hypothetical protein